MEDVVEDVVEDVLEDVVRAVGASVGDPGVEPLAELLNMEDGVAGVRGGVVGTMVDAAALKVSSSVICDLFQRQKKINEMSYRSLIIILRRAAFRTDILSQTLFLTLIEPNVRC